ncbi:MAG: hypothetical protein Q4B87_01290 [Candidatus Saccharibacteria bacterium]|nr:hypothetical protein [Candidatus Saccharibacteria bacterium]
MLDKKKGTIDISALNHPPEPHEYKTAKFFSNLGLDINFIKPSNTKGTKSPDFEMASKNWETKSPIRYSDSSFEDNFKKAIKQSEHVIYDLRRLSPSDEKKYIGQLQNRKKSRNLKTLLVITRDGNLLTEKGIFVKIKS